MTTAPHPHIHSRPPSSRVQPSPPQYLFFFFYAYDLTHNCHGDQREGGGEKSCLINCLFVGNNVSRDPTSGDPSLFRCPRDYCHLHTRARHITSLHGSHVHAIRRKEGCTELPENGGIFRVENEWGFFFFALPLLAMLIEPCSKASREEGRHDSRRSEAAPSAAARRAALDAAAKTPKRPCYSPSRIYRLIHHVLTLTERLHSPNTPSDDEDEDEDEYSCHHTVF